jgi:diguanylate cyclase (GGDEF)-like protein
MDIGVFTDRDDLLGSLSGKCPEHSFRRCRERADAELLIVDHASVAASPAGEPLFTVHVGDSEIRQGGPHEVWVTEHEMVEHPRAVLGAAERLVSLRRRLLDLEEAAAADAEVRSLLAEPDLETFCRRVSEALSLHLSFTSASFYFHDPVRESFIRAWSAEDEPLSDEQLAGEVLERLHDAVGTTYPHVLLDALDGTVRLALPMLANEDLIGVFVGRLGQGARPAEASLDGAMRYIASIMPLIINARQFSQSRDLAMRDDLTKAYNRRFFESYLDEEIERTRRYGSVFSIIFLDLDDLKNINSSHGHLTGSRVLQEVAKRVLSAVRTIDKVVRFGGDEFCIILPETDKDQAMSVAMRVRKAMSATPFEIDENLEVRITASFGIATYPIHALSKDGLIRQADEAMYRVKSTTKNAIGVAGEFNNASRAGTGV